VIRARPVAAGSLLIVCWAAACSASGTSIADGGADSGGVPSVAPSAATRAPSATAGVVSNVVDGDTVDVEGVGRIRVIGIDTPERGACGYDSATLAMAALVLGEPVTLVPGATEDVDRYGRLLRYLDVGATDAGLELIEDGWAIARYDSRDGYGAHPREVAYVAADQAAPDLGCYPDDEP
jgi:endonuclease YncB( thermonuclease family)